MCAISAACLPQPRPMKNRLLRYRAWKALAAVAAAAVLLVAIMPFFHSEPGSNGHGTGGHSTAFSLLSQACAAEDTLLGRMELVHMVNEILVKPVADAELARLRWFPLVSIDAAGKPHYDQLALAGEPGQGYTVNDECWYDPATGRFARVLTTKGRPIYANSYDGTNVCSLESAGSAGAHVVKQPAVKDFRPPHSPAQFLGMAAGLPSGLDEKDETRVRDVGDVVLDDGTRGRQVKVGFPRGGPKQMEDCYLLVTIRTVSVNAGTVNAGNNTIEKMEMTLQGQSMYVLRRVKAETASVPRIGWDLAGLALPPAGAAPTEGPHVLANIVVPDVSVEQMVAKADFTTYVFAQDPPWAGHREITDILDIPSPPHRMFAVSYRAADGRHVVLLQSYSYNKMLGPAIMNFGKVVYTSPRAGDAGGVKVWSGPMGQWLAKILLQSAQAVTHAAPGKNLTGYLLETPEHTFPALAINGQVSQKELHSLVDSLVPATGKTRQMRPAVPTVAKPVPSGAQD